MPRKSASSSGPLEKREHWKDKHYHNVVRNKGRFVSTRRWYKPVKFGKDLTYTYVVHIKDGTKKGKTTLVSSNKKIYAPRGSGGRRAIYDAVKEKYSEYGFEIHSMRLMSTFDTVTGERVRW